MSYHNDPLNATDTKNINVYNHRRIGKFFLVGKIEVFSFVDVGRANITKFIRYTRRQKYMFVYQVRCTNEITIKFCRIELDRLRRNILVSMIAFAHDTNLERFVYFLIISSKMFSTAMFW